MMQMKPQGVVAQVRQTLSELPDDQRAALVEALTTAPGLTAAQRRAGLALRIAMARLAPLPEPAPKAAPEPAPAPVPPPVVMEPAPQPAPEVIPEPEPEETPPPPPAPEVKKPRKPAKVAMSTVRLEDAAMLLGAAFAAMDSDTPAPAPPAADTPAPPRDPKPAIVLPPFPDDD
jgi:hypothetical protein